MAHGSIVCLCKELGALACACMYAGAYANTSRAPSPPATNALEDIQEIAKLAKSHPPIHDGTPIWRGSHDGVGINAVWMRGEVHIYVDPGHPDAKRRAAISWVRACFPELE